MLDVAWPELFVVGAVALVAIGPKDMPKAMYTLGRWAGKARRFMSEMSRAFNEMADEAEKAAPPDNLKVKVPSDDLR